MTTQQTHCFDYSQFEYKQLITQDLQKRPHFFPWCICSIIYMVQMPLGLYTSILTTHVRFLCLRVRFICLCSIVLYCACTQL